MCIIGRNPLWDFKCILNAENECIKLILSHVDGYFYLTNVQHCHFWRIAGLFWHSEESHGLVYYQTEARHGPVPRTMAIRGWHLAHVQQRLAVQPQDVTGLQVLLQAGGGVWTGDRPGHAEPWLLLWEKGKMECLYLLR